MDILFLAHRVPFPPDRGDKIRSFHMLKRLAGLGRVHLGCFADDEADAANFAGLREALGDRLGESHAELRRTDRARAAFEALLSGSPMSLTLFEGAGLRDFISRLLGSRSIAAIFAFSGQMAQFVPAAGPRFVMDFVDVDSAKFAALAKGRGLLAPIYRREARLLAAFERATAVRADASLFVTEAEAALFRRRVDLPNADIRAIHNGVDVDHFDPDVDFPPIPERTRGEGPIILFTGQMDYRPNVDAVTGFAADMLPVIRRRHPKARFVIAGRNPVPEVRRLASNAVTVTGAVPDMRSWLATADLVVAPLAVARGVQNKVLEAMAMGRAVVASPAAFEGIEAEPGRDLVVTDRAAEAVSQLLDDPERRQALGRAARLQMEKRYRWEACLAPLAKIVRPETRRAA